jgi:hypothetical protein
MAAPVTPLNATAGPPKLDRGDAASMLLACEARVRHAADRLETAVSAMRELRGVVAEMREVNARHRRDAL